MPFLTVESGSKPGRFTSILVAFSRLLNATIGGYSGEMLSARAYRRNWQTLVFILDSAFFWQDQHCKACYEWERDGVDRPGAY